MSKKGKFFAGVLVGGLVGATAALLMAPKSGKDLRQELRKRYQEMEKDVNKALAKTQKVTKDSYNALVDQVVKAYEKVKDLDTKDLDEIKHALLSKWDMVQNKAEAEGDKIEDKAEALVKKAKRIVRKKAE